jgi:hypothetical protein
VAVAFVTLEARHPRQEPIAELVVLPAAILLMAAIRSGLAWNPTGEPPRYFDVAGKLLAGLVPYLQVPSEYPPLAFVPWLVPRLLSGDDVHAYAWLLAIQNAALATGVALCLAWLARRHWARGATSVVLALAALMVVALAPVAVWLFDLLPALLTGLALIATARGGWGTAGILLGLGTLAKLYPAVLVPLFAAWPLVAGERRALTRFLAGFGAALAIVMLPVLLLAGSHALSFLDYHRERGLQLESVPAGLVLLDRLCCGGVATLGHAFGAWEVHSPLADAMAAAQPLVMIALVALVLVAGALRFRDDVRSRGTVQPASVIAYAAAAILATIVTSKVLSPQFLVWLLPFVPLLPRSQAWLALAASGLTLLLLGSNYVGMMEMRPDHVVALNARNVLLVALLVWLVAANRPSLGRRGGIGSAPC